MNVEEDVEPSIEKGPRVDSSSENRIQVQLGSKSVRYREL